MTAETPRPGSRSLLIAGGGLPSLALALALKQAHGPALAVTVIDPGAADPARHRGRAYALAAGGRRMLERLGLWARVTDAAEPIAEMVISDSRLADPVRPVFLTFGREAEDEGDDGESGHCRGRPRLEPRVKQRESRGPNEGQDHGCDDRWETGVASRTREATDL